MNYRQWYSSPERKVGNGLKMMVLGIAACCVPGGQTVGILAIAKGVAKIGITVAKAGSEEEKE